MEECLRFSVFMARFARGLCSILADLPLMWFVTDDAFHSDHIDMEIVFADLLDLPVALETVGLFRFYLGMGFMTGIAFERHRGPLREFYPFGRGLLHHIRIRGEMFGIHGLWGQGDP